MHRGGRQAGPDASRADAGARAPGAMGEAASGARCAAGDGRAGCGGWGRADARVRRRPGAGSVRYGVAAQRTGAQEVWPERAAGPGAPGAAPVAETPGFR